MEYPAQPRVTNRASIITEPLQYRWHATEGKKSAKNWKEKGGDGKEETRESGWKDKRASVRKTEGTGEKSSAGEKKCRKKEN